VNLVEESGKLRNHGRQQALKLVASLSPKEAQILAGLVNGCSLTSIAASLSIDADEVEKAKRVLMDKLSARNTADAVRIGLYANVSWPH
jgi:two-component system, LuxR family, response regulator FixJ